MKKRGNSVKAQSEVIVVILLILIALVAILIVWNLVALLIKSSSNKIDIIPFSMSGNLEYALPLGSTKNEIYVKVERRTGEGEISGVRIIFTANDGKSYSYENKVNYPNLLETKMYSISKDDVNIKPPISNFDNIVKVSVYFLYKQNGKDVVNPIEIASSTSPLDSIIPVVNNCDPACQYHATCSGTSCVCDGDWGDCNGAGAGNDGDGCETDLLTTFAHCGNCATSCIGTQTCTNGACVAASACTLASDCGGGTGCNGKTPYTCNAAHQCVPGTACPGNCYNAVCVGCNAVGDCGTSPFCGTGVDINKYFTRTCNSHACGISTGTACAGGIPYCSAGTCVANCPQSCSILGYNCGTYNFCGVSINCGTCGANTVSCTSGNCICAVNFGNCDSNPLTCEANFLIDNNHCGDCTTICTGGKTCIDGSCASPTCTVSWVQTGSVSGNNWDSIASSDTGSKLVAVGYDKYLYDKYLYTSPDFGVTWVDHFRNNWLGTASSDDGVKLAAVALGDYIWTSSNSGTGWQTQFNSGVRDWTSIASSDNGLKLIATVKNGNIWTSSDQGVSWTERTTPGLRDWKAIASSSSGVKVAVAPNNGNIWTSTASGVFGWTERTNSGIRAWTSIASSDDGSVLIAGTSNGLVYISIDSGVNWNPKLQTGYWTGVAVSGDKTRLAAADYGFTINGYIYVSFDSGTTWIRQDTALPRRWSAVAFSGDGTRLFAADYSGYIWAGTITCP